MQGHSMTYLGTRDLPIDAITPHPGNPRQGNVAVIEESLRRNEQYRSIVVQANDLRAALGPQCRLGRHRPQPRCGLGGHSRTGGSAMVY
jgi:hypothetical protein